MATPNPKKLKRGRGSQSKINVDVMAESTPFEDIHSGKKTSQFRYAKMKALKTHKADEINGVASKNIDSQSSVIIDKSTSYEDFSPLFVKHVSLKSNKETTKTSLIWGHVTISKAKRNLLGIYHMIKMSNSRTTLTNFAIG